jgi:lysophospholipase L1-like esterase
MVNRLLSSRWSCTCRGVAAAALLALLVALAPPASASTTRLYVDFGDSVGAGFGASAGHSYFDLYCAYLESSSIVDQCVNEAVAGTTSGSALTGGMVQNVINDIESSTDTPVVTVSLGGNDVRLTCQSITAPGCPFISNMRTILDELETALATRPGAHTIQWLEYYNPNHDNPFGSASLDQSTAALLLGDDFAYTACTSYQLNLIGLNDVINCIAKEKGATPVDAYMPFQLNCTNNDCFSDSLHPDDKGYGLIFDAFRDTPGSPVPSKPPPDGGWPYAVSPTPTISGLSESRHKFAPSSARHAGGTVFSFQLAQPARVFIVIELKAPGRRVDGACRRPSRRLRNRPPCIRTISIGAITRQEPAGLDRIAFSGRIRGRPLKPGRYVAEFSALNAITVSAQRRLWFTVT